jgi:hypothetical protein
MKDNEFIFKKKSALLLMELNTNTSNSISKIKEFINKFFEYLKTNKLFVVFFVVAFLIIILTYYYSENYRTKSRVNNLLNTLKYTKKREQIDFCGSDNSVVDKMYTGVEFNKEENSIKLDNLNINLFDIGLSSEYMVTIEGSSLNNGTFKVEKVVDKSTLRIDKSKKIKVSENSVEPITQPREASDSFIDDVNILKEDNIVITYFRPNSKINPYKYKKLTDYYIASSHRSFLVGYQKADYCSLDMINKVLYFGARYIELEIFDDTNNKDSNPIVSSGYNDGSTKLTLNKVDLSDCLKLIAEIAFSESHILNFNDPLFLFLNLKVNNNQSTLNKIAKLVKENLGNRLLPKKFLNTNIGNATLCDLESKLVILSSSGWKDSDLEDVVNCSTDSPYLNRFTFNEIKTYSERSKPKTTIRKNTIKFSKGATNSSIEFFDNTVDLTKLGINDGDNLVIKGAKRTENNSGNFLFKIQDFSKRKIIFDKKVKLSNENPGAMVNIDIYDFSYRGEQQTLEEFNKTNLTICVPDDRFFSSNYNYKEAIYKGCQFIAMNYQSVDAYMKEYFDYFMERSFKFKPSSLINEKIMTKMEGVASLIPNEKPSLDFDVDYNFLQTYMNRVITITTESYPNLNLGIDERDKDLIGDKHIPARMVLDGDNKHIEFMVVKGRDNRSDTISLLLLDDNGSDVKKFLKFNDNCCFLTYDTLDNESEDPIKERQKLRNMSFIPLKTINNKESHSRFGVIMRKTVGGESSEVLYYLKHRKEFSPKKKLFTKITTRYKLKTFLYRNNNDLNDANYKNDLSNYVAVLTPEIFGNDNFLPLGDIIVNVDELDTGKQSEKAFSSSENIFDNVFVKSKQPNVKTMIVNGAVAHPEDYQLLFENRYFQDENNKIQFDKKMPLTIWRPVAPEGFTALGFVFNNSFNKPEKEAIYCVSNDFIKEQPYSPKFYNEIFDNIETSINIWKRDSENQNSGILNYGVVNNTRPLDENGELKKPNPFDNQHYIINLDRGDYRDRIYLDNLIENNESDRKSCNFLISLSSKKNTNQDNKRYDKLLEIEGVESKLMSFTKNKGGGTMCMGLPHSYTSSYYKEVNERGNTGQDGMNDSKLMGMSCGDASNFGTNFRYYNDYSIRLSDNNKNCVTHKPDERNNANKNIDDENNFLYLSKCKRDLKNQLFTLDDNRVKVFADGGEEPNACVTISPENALRLEECGDQKFTALRLWDDNITREDKCFKEEADKALEEISNIEICEDNSYYVIYLDGIMKHEELCDLNSAKSKYQEIKEKATSTGIAGVALGHKGRFIEATMYPIPNPFEIELESLSLKRGECYKCEKPSRMLCSKQRLEQSTYNSFNNFEEEQRLMKYCMTMRDVDDFRCGRANRQKFLTFPVPEDYCLNFGKKVYVQFPEILDSEESGIDSTTKMELRYLFKRIKNKQNLEQLPVQNLLNEYYNTDNYTIFIKATLRPSENKKYKLIFDLDSISEKLRKYFKPISVFKTSEYICLDYEPKESMLRVGSKVLVNFDNFYPKAGSGIEENSQKLKKEGIKYFGVIVKKFSSKYYRVMLSINSYESNLEMITKVGVKYYESNPVFNMNIKDITLFKRSDVCL